MVKQCKPVESDKQNCVFRIVYALHMYNAHILAHEPEHTIEVKSIVANKRKITNWFKQGLCNKTEWINITGIRR